MAGNLKKILIIGNVGSDPQMRYTTDGTPVASFSVAVNERTRRGQAPDGGQGEQQEVPPTWFRVSAWRHQAEIVNDLIKKGMSVFVSGNLRISEFTGNDGQRRTSLEVQMDDMQLLTPKGVGEAGSFEQPAGFGGPAPSRPSTSFGGRQAGPRPVPDISSQEDEDIPF